MAAWTIGVVALLLGTGPQAAMGGVAMASGQAMPAGAPVQDHAAPAPVCPATPAPLPAAYAGWATMTPLIGATAAAGAPMLAIGSGARVTLADAATVRFAAAPGHVPVSGSKAGLVALSVPAAGRYRVALGTGAWIDLVQGAAALRSVAHDHGPACSAIRKLVDFGLQPGRYILQLSGTAVPAMAVMVVKLPG